MTSAAFVDAGWTDVLGRLFRREDLPAELATAAFDEILNGRADPVHIAAFVAGLRTKGESIEEMTGLAAAMRQNGERVELSVEAIDTCGTGGDRAGTINVSTGAALICAGAGVSVCKHGNRAASSQAGSADVLEALGVVIDLGPLGVAHCVEAAGIGFCFAPRFHPAMRHVAPIRAALGVPTIFNFLGPLANPAGVKCQMVGVGDSAMAEKMLGVLEANGATHAIVCYGEDGLDELSTGAPSVVLESRLLPDGDREQRRYLLDATALGVEPASREQLRGGDAAENARRLRAILAGEEGPQRDIVCLNAAAALYVADAAPDIAAGLKLASETVESGAAIEALDRMIEVSQRARSEGI